MKAQIIGFKHLQGTKNGRPYDGYLLHYSHPSRDKDFSGMEVANDYVNTECFVKLPTIGQKVDISFTPDYRGQAVIDEIRPIE